VIIAGGTIGIAGGLMVLLLQGAYANNLSWQHASLNTGPTTVRSSAGSPNGTVSGQEVERSIRAGSEVSLGCGSIPVKASSDAKAFCVRECSAPPGPGE
jgi:hypothetical protein